MAEPAVQILVLMAAFQIKHVLADYYLQNEYMLAGRSVYLHMGRALHAGVHAVGTFGILALAGADISWVIALSLAELVVHFHIDWAKAALTERQQLTPKDAVFWRLTGLDQALHQLTYIAILAIWVLG